MKRTIGLFTLALLLALGAVAWAAADKATPPKSGDWKDAVQACTDMMQDPGVTEQDKKAMRDGGVMDGQGGMMRPPDAGRASKGAP